MTPIHIDAYLIPPGTVLFVKDPEPGTTIVQDWRPVLDDPCAVHAVGLPEFESAFEFDDDGSIPELGILGGVATVELFVVVGLSSVMDLAHGTTCSGWAAGYIIEGGYADLRASLPTIYEHAKRMCAPEPPSKFLSRPKKGYDPEEKQPYNVTILTMWQAESSRDWESGQTSLDALHYIGPGKTILIEDYQPPVNVAREVLKVSTGQQVNEFDRPIQLPEGTSLTFRNVQPTTLQIGCGNGWVIIDYTTGEVVCKDCSLDDGAKAFWDAVGKYFIPKV